MTKYDKILIFLGSTNPGLEMSKINKAIKGGGGGGVGSGTKIP